MPNAPVLLVDAFVDGLELYSTALALAGIESDVTSSPADVLDRIEEGQPRVLVTSLRLPGASAPELITRIRNRVKDELYIVGLTTNEPAERSAAQDAGCDLVLPVPCLPETLVGELRRVIH